MNAFRVEQALRAARLAFAGATKDLAYVRSRRPSGAFGPDYFLLDVLYRAVRRTLPKSVVEFGSGWSTYVIAAALDANARDRGVQGFLHSIDADQRWADVTRASVPEPLRRYCSVSHSDVMEESVGGTGVYRHLATPAVAADMVVVDGPKLSVSVRAIADPLDIEARTDRGLQIFIDKRAQAAEFLLRNLKRRYRLRIIRGLVDRAAMVHHLEPVPA